MLYTLNVCNQSMINLECGSVDVCLAPIIIHLTDHGGNWMNYVFCLDGQYIQTAKNLWHNAICGNFLDYSAQKRELTILYIFYYQFFFFFWCKSIGDLFLSFSHWLAYCQTVCMFHYSNVNWAVSMLCCAQWQKLKRWAFHMGHVIEH